MCTSITGDLIAEIASAIAREVCVYAPALRIIPCAENPFSCSLSMMSPSWFDW